jgi:hypothetical protein
VTDPPYGLMEGLGSYYVPLAQRLTNLLALALLRLRLGGRLVFLLPVPANALEADVLPDSLPTSRWLHVESICRQRLSMRLHRLLVTMVKIADVEPSDLPDVSRLRAGEGPSRPAGDEDDCEKPWVEWWTAVSAIEQANAAEASRVW